MKTGFAPDQTPEPAAVRLQLHENSLSNMITICRGVTMHGKNAGLF